MFIYSSSFGDLLPSLISATATLIVGFLALMIWREQKKMSQRQLFIPLWEHISQLRDINPENPVIPDIVKTVNTLELIAKCYESAAVDKKLIKTSFKNSYIALYEQIKHYENINKNGAIFLDNKGSITNIYKEFTTKRWWQKPLERKNMKPEDNSL